MFLTKSAFRCLVASLEAHQGGWNPDTNPDIFLRIPTFTWRHREFCVLQRQRLYLALVEAQGAQVGDAGFGDQVQDVVAWSEEGDAEGLAPQASPLARGSERPGRDGLGRSCERQRLLR